VRTLLVANRGEIASRVFSTARAMGIGTVAVYADPDAGLPFVRDADVAVALRGSSAAETYLSIAKLLDAAARSGADAVHPGYGFLAENADFTRAVIDAGLTWVGPPPDVIAAMGDKVQAKRIAGEAGVPLLPSTVLEGDDPVAWLAAVEAAGIGWPLLVKAAAGGGGRGMREVESADRLAAAVASARREAESAFGDGTVFAERLVRGGRHVEVQVLGDTHGTVIHLGERECSIQRRHQKIVEEAPSPGITAAVRTRILDAGVALARHIGYVNAGTVELLVDGEGDGAELFFLEMNTRLQVEHRVTERYTGRDLVEDQLRIARGEPVLDTHDGGGFHGHAIEVRLYAEDPADGFAPSFGTLHRFDDAWPSDASVETGSEVGTHFDPMLAKLYTSQPERYRAIQLLAAELRNFQVHGVTTNRDLLVAILDHPAFVAGDTTTDFLERFPELLTAGPSEETRRVHEEAAARVRGHVARCTGPWPFAPAGWRLGTSEPAPLRIEHHDDGAFGIDACVTFELDGLTHTCDVHVVGDLQGESTAYVNSGGGQTTHVEAPRFADPVTAGASGAGPVAPVPGTIVAVEVAEGDAVEAGQVLVVLEAMKMEHRIEAHADGTVEAVLVAPGDRVDAHQLLVRLTS
jgi:acetyl/propionyl-CoA carboxylase alpha subunit